MNIYIGQKFGRLTVTAKAETRVYKGGQQASCWLCRCDCGGQVIKQNTILKKTLNPGCKNCETERRAAIHLTHGGAKGGKTRLYNIWRGMRKRCSNPNEARYRDYGARGIVVCQEWSDFSVFREWAMENGYNDDLSIDRIDNDKGYYADNCRWADDKTQSCNRRNSKLVMLNGFKFNISDAERLLGIGYGSVNSRRQTTGCTHQEAVEYFRLRNELKVMESNLSIIRNCRSILQGALAA